MKTKIKLTNGKNACIDEIITYKHDDGSQSVAAHNYNTEKSYEMVRNNCDQILWEKIN